MAEDLKDLSETELRALPWLFDAWALPHQRPPGGAWRTWLILGGRGAGKTRAGAEWVRARVEGARARSPGRSRRIALVGETYDQAREVMVFGESGLLATSPPDRRPEWRATRRMLEWPNGAQATLHSASEPESLRGPQFDAAWVDELAKWKKGEDAWRMLALALRLGEDPRVCATTTPRSGPLLRQIMDLPSTVVTHAVSEANAANLAPGFLREMRAMLGAGALASQELDGVYIETPPGALWSHDLIARARGPRPDGIDRIVVAVDPPASGHSRSDACGIVVAGAVAGASRTEWRACVLEDATVEAASPHVWARAAVEAYHRHGADRLVAEVNMGGAMVAAVVRQVDPLVNYRAVHATKSKGVRAEPVAALYEQGRIVHAGAFPALEAEMLLMTARGYDGPGSPDRVDALVWALSDLQAASGGAGPRMRPIQR
ncbi:DNA-packaging protein [Wenxinia saemankumensis]|uniref:DNA-packaging protein n=1 Tax=Wenxinia saemankumensis TaxID=1447782 RepID=UPI000933F069